MVQGGSTITQQVAKAFLTSERTHLAGQAYLWPRWSEGPRWALLHGSKMIFVRDPPLSLSPSLRANAQSSSHCRPVSCPPPFGAVLLSPLIFPVSCSTHITHGSSQDFQRSPITILRLLPRTILEQSLHGSFLRRNTIRRSRKSVRRPSTQTLPPIMSIGLSVYLRSKSSLSSYLRD